MAIGSHLVSTYSILAVDRAVGLMGIAVHSHFFAVGPIVAWAEAGIGLVATQSIVNPDFGPRGLHMLRSRTSPAGTLDALLADDSAPAVRQVAVMTPDGISATHTGHRCIAHAGHAADRNVSAQANMMDRPGVPEAMIERFQTTEGTLAERLTAALEAAEAAGGDVRGKQSAAMVIVSTEPVDEVRRARPLDLRVDDHPEPLSELRRLLDLRAAYDAADDGDHALAAGDREAATRHYARSRELAPDRVEPGYWELIGNASVAGDELQLREIREKLRGLDQQSGGRWRRLTARLPATGLFALDSTAWDLLISPRPGRIFHIVGARQEAEADLFPIRPDEAGGEHFVHCSYAHQLSDVVARFFPGVDDPFLVEIDPGRLDAELVVEDSYGAGETFPHVYGIIDAAAVRATGRASELLPEFFARSPV